MDYLDIATAKEHTGLRLVLTAGVPGPWGEAAKSIFHAKGLAYAPVRQEAGQANGELLDWTGHANAPQAIYEAERARVGWVEILYLAERLAPEPRLIPESPADRVHMFGLGNEICGEMGFGWCRRLELIDGLLRNDTGEGDALQMPRTLGRRYGYDRDLAAAAPGRIIEILELLSNQLESQKARGSRYFIGDTLTALDLWWAPFAAMIEPLPEDQCPMNAFMRRSYELTNPDQRKAADPLLLEHRDYIYAEYLRLPLDF